MKDSGGCHCGQFKFETKLKPMVTYQCNCTSCRRLTGSVSMGMMYQEDEVTFSGDEVHYEYEGGSGGNMKTGFCPKCHTRVTSRPEVMAGVVALPLGTFDDSKSFDGLKLEIWTSEKLSFVKDNGCFEMSVEDSGVQERFMGLLEALDNR